MGGAWEGAGGAAGQWMRKPATKARVELFSGRGSIPFELTKTWLSPSLLTHLAQGFLFLAIASKRLSRSPFSAAKIIPRLRVERLDDLVDAPPRMQALILGHPLVDPLWLDYLLQHRPAGIFRGKLLKHSSPPCFNALFRSTRYMGTEARAQ